MYASGEEAIQGDIVRSIGGGDEGEVVNVVPKGAVSGGVEDVVVQWSTIYEISPGYNSRKAPVQVPSQSLVLARRKSTA